MSRIDSIEFFETFQRYINDWRELERQYYKIPSWRTFKQLRNIKKRENLTRVFVARMRKRGLLNEKGI